MITHYLIACGLFAAMFVLFLVISRTLNNIINQLAKLDYLLKKEFELQNETLAIKRLMTDEGSGEPSGEKRP
jgi:hypothetical protein